MKFLKPLLAGDGSITVPAFSYSSATGYGNYKTTVTFEGANYTGQGLALGNSTQSFVIGRENNNMAMGPAPFSGCSLLIVSGQAASGASGSLTFKTPGLFSGNGGSGGFVMSSGASAGSGFGSGAFFLSTGDASNDANSGDITIATGFVTGSATAGKVIFQSGCNEDLVSGTIDFTMGATGLGMHISDDFVTVDVPIIFTGGIVGVIDASSSPTGMVGEPVEFELAIDSATSLTTATPKTVISGELPPGKWEIEGLVGFKPAATTSLTFCKNGMHTTTNAFGGLGTYQQLSILGVVNADQVFVCPKYYLNVDAATTVYLVAQAIFTISTCTAYGKITARRVG